jgi:glycosyltransferase involved in cell wall biosynthesis
LVEKLCWLQDHPENAISMGASGRERILQEFTTDKMVKNTINVFEQLISRQSI